MAKRSKVKRSDELSSVFGGLRDLIHVADPESFDLLLMSEVLTEKVGEAEGQKCYFALFGRGSPCPHCVGRRLLDEDAGTEIVREFFDEAEQTWYRHVDRLIDWPDGRRVHMQMATDITDLKRAENALRQSEAKYKQLLANAQEGIAVIQDGRLAFFNPQLPQSTGYSAGELQNLPFAQLIHLDDRALVLQRYARRVRGEVVPGNYESRLVTKGGGTRWVEINAVLITWDGRPATLNFITDVTEKRAAVDVLRERETLFRSTIESTGDGMLIVDRGGKVIHANARYAEMWCVPKDVLAERDVKLLRARGAELVVDAEPFVERSAAVYDTDDESFETVEFKDGRTVERYSSPLIQDGENIGRVWCFRDVTERKQAERALAENEERLRLVFETAGDAIFVLKNGVFVDCNSMAMDMFGATREEITGRSPEILFPPTQADGRPSVEVADEIIAACFGGERQSREWVHRRFDGTDFPSEVSLDTFELAGQKYLQAIVHDTTERKRAEEVRDVLFQISQAVNESTGLDELLVIVHQQLGRLLDTTNHFVALYEGDTDTYSFPYYIDEEDELEDLSPTQLKKSLTDYVRRTGKPILVNEKVHRELEKAGEVELIGSASPIWLGVPLKVEQRVIGVVVVQSYVEGSLYTERDLEIMTFVSDNIAVAIERVRAKEERELLEAQIQHAQKLESLGVLAGGIAHDFNNLLTGILGNADLALLDTSSECPAWQCLSEIKSAAQRAADLSRQMLAYSGKGSFVIEAIDVNDVVREMANLLDVSISKKAVLEYDLSDDLSPIVGDATQLRQVIMNLITNASDAIGEDEGTISISSRAVDCDRAYLSECYLVEDVPEGWFVSLKIADTGCGMDEETRQRIFDPFFTTKFTGRGLGLASTLGIVRGHGGAVRVTSEKGRGTTFEVLFPVGEVCNPRKDGPKEEAHTWNGSGTVLVVDDEEAVREVAARMLEQAGLSVARASDGLEAVEFFKTHGDEVGCVLLDLTMPRMSGEETLRELRGIRENVQVVLSSGYSEQEVVGRFAGQDISGFVQKPYLVSKLIAKVGEALGDASRADS